MCKPPHPGGSLRDEIIEHAGFTVSEAARRLGMTRMQLSRVLNERSGISPELAIRLEKAGVGTARHWMARQAAYELWHAEQDERPEILSLAC
ncbi:HigA family addiction module antitoxin [Halomonas huangheensis]|nr:HigA family addiction module antitoxin [Halomonas huangheensis]